MRETSWNHRAGTETQTPDSKCHLHNTVEPLELGGSSGGALAEVWETRYARAGQLGSS